jgi:hypothetical protein
MARGPLFQGGYRPQFSGHETFPLRYGWLKKAYDAVVETESEQGKKLVFLEDDAIARFGVGKNMVASMRHWASTSGILEEPQEGLRIRPTELGDLLLRADGLDPYMEYPATLWLVHWHLAARPKTTTWFWAFNHYPDVIFDRDHLEKGISRLAKERGWTRVSPATVKNDVACFVRTYAAQAHTGKSGNDDAFESPLTELGLIKSTGKRDGFRFVRGPKATLGDGVFIFALMDFWAAYSPTTSTLSFEAIAHEPGSPGRVFLLDENDTADRLFGLEEATAGALRWSETAGLKQVFLQTGASLENRCNYIKDDYAGITHRGEN